MTFNFEPTPSEIIAYVIALVSAVITGAIAVRKRFSTVSVSVAKDAAQVDIMDVLRGEIKNLRDQNNILTVERNGAMKDLGALGAQVTMFTNLLSEIRTEQRSVAVDAKGIARALIDTTALTQEAVDEAKNAGKEAKAAFIEANTVNKKIEKIGLKVVDGSRLNEQEATPQDPKGEKVGDAAVGQPTPPQKAA